MATSSSTSGDGAKSAPVVRADGNTGLEASSKSSSPAHQTLEAGAAAAKRPSATATPTPDPPPMSDQLGKSQRLAPESTSRTAPQAQGTPTASKKPKKPFNKPLQFDLPAPVPKVQSKEAAASAKPTERPKKQATRAQDAGLPEASAKKIVQPQKDQEKDTSTKKRGVAEIDNPYTKGRMSTATALRHLGVHLAAGLVGGHLLNNAIDKKVVRKSETFATRSESSRHDGARGRAADTQTNASPRHQQQARISRALAQAAAVPAMNLAPTTSQSATRRAADNQAQLIGRPEQQARIARAHLQAAPVKAKGRGR